MAAIGNSGAQIDPERRSISGLGNCGFAGMAAGSGDGCGRSARLSEAAGVFDPIDLHQGEGNCVFWTTDLTAEYVRINADYSTYRVA
jgi:glutamate N-acetyltransferase/amino-acid N-acetyltransferase